MAADREGFTGSLPVLCECPHLDVNIFTLTIFHSISNQNISFHTFHSPLLHGMSNFNSGAFKVLFLNGCMHSMHRTIHTLEFQKVRFLESFVKHSNI